MSILKEYLGIFSDKYLTMPKIYASDIVEIFIIAVLVYYIMIWFQRSRAWTLFKGIIVIVLFMFAAVLFNLTTILWIADKTLSVGIIAIIIIFQPELRKALEELGKKNVISRYFKFGSNTGGDRFSDRSIEEIVRATVDLAKVKTGALIVIAKEQDLTEYEETGIRLDADISRQLFINIFEKNTPLHDGAVIIDGDKITAATCYLPLSNSTSLSKDLGTRHRAGVGISEVSDSVVVIVSEETGSISIARDGKLIRYADAATLKNELKKVQAKEEVKSKKKKGWRRNEVTKKLRESITNNIMLKIAAVFIAALIWLAVVNLSDPTKTITIYGIPINLTDEEAITDQNKVYKVDQRLTLNVTITGKRSVISELSSDDFTAVAPLDEISVANSVQVEVSVNKKNVENKISIVNQSVKAVSVDVEDLVDEQYPVEVEITGELAKGYYLGGYSNSRNNIIVTAPESVQHKIDKAKVIVDVSNASQSFEEKYKIKLYDENGNTIKNTNVTKNYNKTKVSIEVLKGNTIPVDVEYSGKPAKGYEVTGVEFEPQKVTLVGKHSLIDSLESIKVPKEDISVDGAKDTVNVEVNLNKYLPDGVSVSDSANAIATITVKVEKLETKKFQINKSDISLQNIESGYIAEISSDSISVSLTGLKSELDKVTPDDIKAVVNLKGINSNKTVDVSLTVPNNTTLKNKVSVKVKVTKK